MSIQAMPYKLVRPKIPADTPAAIWVTTRLRSEGRWVCLDTLDISELICAYDWLPWCSASVYRQNTCLMGRLFDHLLLVEPASSYATSNPGPGRTDCRGKTEENQDRSGYAGNFKFYCRCATGLAVRSGSESQSSAQESQWVTPGPHSHLARASLWNAAGLTVWFPHELKEPCNCVNLSFNPS